MTEQPGVKMSFKLNNGIDMPAVGLGTFQPSMEEEEQVEESVVHALQSGYRLIDTAQLYGTEPLIGRAMRKSGVPRSEICLVTKFWGEWHHDPAEALRISLKELDTDYVDVFLMHWPWATTPDKKLVYKHESPTIVETWKMMEKLVGPKCKAIGVSNFTPKLLDELLEVATIVPAVNQIELHPFNPHPVMVPYCQEKGIHLMAWSPFADNPKSASFNHEMFRRIAEHHDCAIANIFLSWIVQRGVTVIPKSINKERIENNAKLVHLTASEMEEMNDAHNRVESYRITDRLAKTRLHGKLTHHGWTAFDMGLEDEHGNWIT